MKKLYIFIAFSAGFAVIALFLAFQLAPWLYAINTRVRLYLDAPADTLISICWDEAKNECLPLVPYSEAGQSIVESGGIASIWLSELPPRPIYHISINFKSVIRGAAIHEMELDSSNVILWGAIPGAGVQNIKIGMDQFETQGITHTLRDDLYYMDGDPGSQLLIPRGIEAGLLGAGIKRTTMMVWSLLFSIYLLFAIPIYLMPFAVQNLGTAIKNARLPHYPWWVYLCCFAAIVLMPLLVANSAVLMHEGDPLVYLLWATRGEWLTAARPPGYQLFVALALWLSDYHLGGVVLLQAIFLSLSAAICTWMLRRWLHPLVAVLFMFFVLFSPAQVHWARWILRDSLFAGLALLAIAAIVAHFTAGNKRTSIIWLVVFSIICGLAFLIRENGILLPVVLAPVLLAEAVKRLKSPGMIWRRMQAVFLLLTHYVPSVLIVGIVYIGLSFYNYMHYEYFQATLHVTSHHFLWKEIGTATFDSRSLLEPGHSMDEIAKTYLGQPLYRSFIVTREKTPGYDPIYASLFPTINQTMAENGQVVNWFHSASILDEIGRSSKALMPWEADLAGALRQYRELLVQNPPDIGGYPMRSDDTAGLAFKQQLLDQLLKKVVYTGKAPGPDSMIGKYYHVTERYIWYRSLFWIALFFCLYILRYEDPIFLAPMAFYVANDILLVIMRTVNTRYYMSLDVLLVLQVALGLSCLIHRYFNLQELAPVVRVQKGI